MAMRPSPQVKISPTTVTIQDVLKRFGESNTKLILNQQIDGRFDVVHKGCVERFQLVLVYQI